MCQATTWYGNTLCNVHIRRHRTCSQLNRRGRACHSIPSLGQTICATHQIKIANTLFKELDDISPRASSEKEFVHSVRRFLLASSETKELDNTSYQYRQVAFLNRLYNYLCNNYEYSDARLRAVMISKIDEATVANIWGAREIYRKRLNELKIRQKSQTILKVSAFIIKDISLIVGDYCI